MGFVGTVLGYLMRSLYSGLIPDLVLGEGIGGQGHLLFSPAFEMRSEVCMDIN